MARALKYSDDEVLAAFRFAGSKVGAARLLGCSPATIYARIPRTPEFASAAWEPWATRQTPVTDDVHRSRVEGVISRLEAVIADPASSTREVLQAATVLAGYLRSYVPAPPPAAPRAETSEAALEDALSRLLPPLQDTNEVG